MVGIAGLMGAGRTEFAMSVFGRSYGHKITGEVLHQRQAGRCQHRAQGDRAGLAYVTEDRKSLGLVLIDHIMHNIDARQSAAVSPRRP